MADPADPAVPVNTSVDGADRACVAGVIALSLLVAVTFAPSLSAGFVWDDETNVTDNPTLKTWDGLIAIWCAPGATQQYYPLTHTSFWIECRLWGLAPVGYHLTNLVLHAMNAVLLWRLLAGLGVPGAFTIAAIFAVHPLQVETVVYVTERKNLLSALLCLLATRRYLAFDRTQARRDYLWAAALFFGALLSKTVIGPWPLVMALLLWFRGRLDGIQVKRLAALMGMAVPLCVVTAWLEVHHVGSIGAAWELTLAERVIIAGRALWFYAAKTVWPDPLMLIYPRWVIDAASLVQYAPAALAAAVPLVAWGLRHRLGRGLLVASAGFGLMLSPILGFFDVYYMRYSFVRDHFQYLAGIFLIAVIVAAVHRLGSVSRVSATWPRRIAGAAAVTVLAFVSFNRAGVYHDAETLWRDTIAQNPSAWVAHHNLGAALFKAGRYAEAKSALEESLRLEPDQAKAYHNLGMIALEEGDPDAAERDFGRAFSLDSRLAKAAYNQGVIRQKRGDAEGALEAFLAAAESDPSLWDAQFNAAVLLEGSGQAEAAIERYRLAIAASPAFAGAHYNLALALYQAGRFSEAWPHVHAAERLGLPLPPDFVAALERASSSNARPSSLRP